MNLHFDICDNDALVVNERFFAAGVPAPSGHPFPERHTVRVKIRPRES
jgi:hypothetical protein